MAAISSVGIGSGLDVKSIVSQLVALEKQPLAALQTKEAGIQTKITTFSQIKSLVSTFADAASKLTLDSGWGAMTVNSSDSTAVNAAVSGVATAGEYAFEVQQLAQSQTSASATAYAAGTTMGPGTLTISTGSGATAKSVAVEIKSTDDTTPAGIASKINAAKAGVVASVVTDATGQRLVLRSAATGAAGAFSVSATGDGPLGSVDFGSPLQTAQDTKATINGVAITSSDRTFTQAVPGMTFSASKVTTAPVQLSITADTAATKKNVQAFVDAYNAINDLVSTSVKYDADTKTAGVLQGDAIAVGLQNTLRSVLGGTTKSTGLYDTLASVGITAARGGALSIDATKFDKIMGTAAGAADVKKLFATKDSGSASTNGVAVKLKALTSQMLSFDGTFNSKADALTAADKRNQTEQDKVNARAAAVEKRLNAQYTALDTQMASLTALNSYVTQQVAAWSKSSS